MLSNDYATSVDLSLRPSAKALRILLILHAVAVILTAISGVAPVPGLCITAGIATSWVLLRRNAAIGFGPHALVRIVWNRDGGWQLEDASGRRNAARLLPGSVLLPGWLTLLSFRLDTGELRTRLLLGDEAGCDPTRRLRARLLNTRMSSEADGRSRDPHSSLDIRKP